MKLLLINDYGISGGGTEKRIALLIDELLQQKIFQEIHLITRYNPTPNLNVTTHHCPRGSSPFSLTWNVIKKYNIDIIQIHNLMALTPTPILAAKLLRKPVIFFAHDYWPLCGRRSFIPAETASRETLCTRPVIKKCISCIGPKATTKLKLWKHILNLCDAGISAGNFLKTLYEQEHVLRNKWTIIPPWINTTVFTNNHQHHPQENILLFVGSLIEFKGAWVAAHALKYIVKKVPDAHLVFIGDLQEPTSRYRQDIERICTDDGTLEHVSFIGKQNWEAIKNWHARAKVYLCPTICMESFGLNWAEAMASGVPVIASAIGSVPEFVKNNGVLVPPRNEQALADAVIKILTDENFARKIARQGQKYAAHHFGISHAVDSLVKLYTYLVR